MSYYNWSFYIFGRAKELRWWTNYGDYEYIHVVEQHGAIVNGRKYAIVLLGVVQFRTPKRFRDVTSICRKKIRWHYYRSDKRMFYRASTLQRGSIFVASIFRAGALILTRWPKIKRWYIQ